MAAVLLHINKGFLKKSLYYKQKKFSAQARAQVKKLNNQQYGGTQLFNKLKNLISISRKANDTEKGTS